MIREAGDTAARAAVLDPGRSFVLEAPAGSGKTALLTARFLALLARVDDPCRILAVTFTRKAAAEMAERISGALAEASDSSATIPEDPWKGLLHRLARAAIERHHARAETLLSPDTFMVSTFHSFCSRVVRAFPLESGVQPGSAVMDEDELESLPTDVVDAYLSELLAGRGTPGEIEAFRRGLLAMNGELGTMSAQLAGLLSRRDRVMEALAAFESGGVPGLSLLLGARLDAVAGLKLNPLARAFSTYAAEWKTLSKILEGRIGVTVPGGGISDIPAWKAARDVFLTRGGTPRKVFSEKDGFPKGFSKHPLAGFIKGLPDAAAECLAGVALWPDPGGDPVGLRELCDMLVLGRGALTGLGRAMKARGMDYSELELSALQALKAAPDPSSGLVFAGAPLMHVLVDEAQDISHVQLELLGRLCAGWREGDGRTVFVVGDPKQSIYRFRRAEVALFGEIARAGVPRPDEAPFTLERRALSANFRSRPPLIDFANSIFAAIMADPRAENDEVGFEPSHAVRKDASGPDPAVTVAVFYDSGADGGNTAGSIPPRDREAAWVAGAVRGLVEEDQGCQVGILMPRRTHLEAYSRAFSEAGVPVRLLEGELLLSKPEAFHLYNLFKALARPHDDLAWAGALRAPWCRIADDELYSLSRGDGPWSGRILSTAGKGDTVARFAAAAGEAMGRIGRAPHSEVVQWLWEDLGGPEAVAARYGAAGVANAMALLEILRSCDGAPLEEAVVLAGGLLERAYTPPDPRAAFSRVHMMTVHKAKGLEFDHVFLVNADYKPGAGRNREGAPLFLMETVPGPGRGALIAASGDRRRTDSLLAYHLLGEIAVLREAAEVKRLFYVAVTRPRRSLAITGKVRILKDGRISSGSREGPLAWLLDMRDALESDGLARWLENPAAGGATKAEASVARLEPPPFEVEPLPYTIENPSRLDVESLLPVESGYEDEDDPRARARGIVIHRLLETLSRGGSLPGGAQVAAALSEEGYPADEAAMVAASILKEAAAAWSCGGLARLLKDARSVTPEFALEESRGGGSLRVGRIDLLVEGANEYSIIDYKTTRHHGELEGWLASQAALHKRQLRAYAEMAARALNVPPEKIRCHVLFTSVPRLVEVR
jgi:ATP-dependent exoDNAse (exonuclease V) beta subunit